MTRWSWAAVAIAIAAVVLSRYELRAEHALALPVEVVPYVVGAVLAAVAVRWVIAAGQGTLHALSAIELAVTAWIACASLATLALPRSALWSYALVPYVLLGATFVGARAVDRATVRTMIAIAGAVVAASVVADAVAGLSVSALRRPGGLLGNRNFAGEYLALALPAALVVFTRSRRWLGVLVVFGLALALTRCRTAWIGAAVALIAVPALSAAAVRRGRALGAAVVVAGALAAPVLPSRLAWTEAHPFASTLGRAVELDRGSGALRLRQVAATWRVLDARGALWTGLGPGRWQAAIGAQERGLARNRIPHSDYVRALSDGGLPALAALCAALIAAALAAWRGRREHPELVGVVAVLALTSLADAPLFRPETIAVAGAVLGVLARGRTCGLEPAAAVPR